MNDQLSIERAANFARFAENLRAFAERQEARAPGRMSHITTSVLTAAALAEETAEAYLVGDKETARTKRAEYAALAQADGNVRMGQGA